MYNNGVFRFNPPQTFRAIKNEVKPKVVAK